MNSMSKYTWSDMERCIECHYKDDDPNICHSEQPAVQKPCRMTYFSGCGRFLAESKWQRMPKEQRDEINEWIRTGRKTQLM